MGRDDEYNADPAQREMKKKKAAAKKLIEEKERAIEEGLKEKLKTIESR